MSRCQSLRTGQTLSFCADCYGLIQRRAPGAEGPQGPQGPPGPGHITFYTIPYGHDGWVVGTDFTGPVAPGTFVISGSDLGNITSNSVVIAQEVNNPNTQPSYGQYGTSTPYCSVWDVFAGGSRLC